MSRQATATEMCARCADEGIGRQGTLTDGVYWFCDEHLDLSGDPPNRGGCDLCGTVTWRYRLPVSMAGVGSDVLRVCDACLPEWAK